MSEFEDPSYRENLVQIKKASRLDTAIRSYREGEVTLGRAAELAGIHRFEFEKILDARGIVKEIKVDSVEELEAGVSVIKNLHISGKRSKGGQFFISTMAKW